LAQVSHRPGGWLAVISGRPRRRRRDAARGRLTSSALGFRQARRDSVTEPRRLEARVCACFEAGFEDGLGLVQLAPASWQTRARARLLAERGSGEILPVASPDAARRDERKGGSRYRWSIFGGAAPTKRGGRATLARPALAEICTRPRFATCEGNASRGARRCLPQAARRSISWPAGVGGWPVSRWPASPGPVRCRDSARRANGEAHH
jgi:hypothetical protein